MVSLFLPRLTMMPKKPQMQMAFKMPAMPFMTFHGPPTTM